MVHHEATDAVRRTVSRATRPALASLRGVRAAVGAGEDRPTTEPVHLPLEVEEVAAMLVAGDLEGADAASRATRSASAYLEARRARLRRELRDMA